MSISRRQYRLWAALSAILAMLFLTPGALAELPNQTAIDTALNELTAAEAAARANRPGNSRIKDAEDALDGAKRANEDMSSDDASKKANAAADEAKAQATADALREELKDRSRDILDGRAEKYREALNNRRAARKKLQALLAEVQSWLRNRRDSAFGTQELEDAINLLRPRLGQSEMPIALQSTALTPLGSMVANVASDSQTYCTFGSGASTPVAFAPADGNGELLPATGKVLASRLLMAPGGVKAPASSGNPEIPAKADKPQGGATSTPQATPTAQAPGASTPPANQSASLPQAPAGSTPAAAGSSPSGSTTVPPPENPMAKSGSDDLETAARVLYGATERKSSAEIPAPPAPGTTDAGSESILDEIGPEREKEMQLESAFQSNTTAETPAEVGPTATPGTAPPVIGPLPAGSSAAGVKAAAEYGPQLNPEMLKPAWERLDAFPTPPDAGNKVQKSAGETGGVDNSAVFDEYIRKLQVLRTGQPPPSRADTPRSGVQAGIKSGAEYGSPAPDASKSPPQSASPPIEPIGKQTGAGTSTPAIASGLGGGGVSAPVDPNATIASDITIHIKATESVLQAGSQGAEIKALFVKLVPTTTPEEPKAGRTKTAKAAVDEGYDQGVVGCVVENGQCRTRLAANDAKAYGLETAGPNIRADLSLRNNTGGVLHKTAPGGAATPNESLLDVAGAALVKKSDFKIGIETFTRVSVAAAGTIAADLLAKFSKDFGPKFQVDHCGEKKPGPPLGMEPVSYSALNSELPRATITLRGMVRSGVNSR